MSRRRVLAYSTICWFARRCWHLAQCQPHHAFPAIPFQRLPESRSERLTAVLKRHGLEPLPRFRHFGKRHCQGGLEIQTTLAPNSPAMRPAL